MPKGKTLWGKKIRAANENRNFTEVFGLHDYRILISIPVNVGAIVQNVGTAFAVYQAVMKNKPLFERYTTVTGKQVKNPGNFLVRMGTPFSQMIENCGGLPEGDNKVLAGGPMMGKAVISLDVPVTKGTNSITR